MGFIKGVMFLGTGAFRPTSKRERHQRLVNSETKAQTQLMRQEQALIQEQTELLRRDAGLPTGSDAAWSDEQLRRYDRLEKLGDLRDKGILTQEEFEREKRSALRGG